MRIFSKYTVSVSTSVGIGMLCGLLGFAAGALANSNARMIMIPFEDVKFTPSDPARPGGALHSVLWGDPATGPSAMLLKLKKGIGPLHVHSSDYHLVLLQGTMKHWLDPAKEAAAKTLAPGSYWFQPGDQPHGGTCLTDECLMFVKWEGKRDGRLAN